MSKETSYSAVDYLRDLAGHFVREDWQWTRRTDIRHIRYRGDWSGHSHPLRRIPRALRAAFGLQPKWMRDVLPIRNPIDWLLNAWAGLRVNLRTESHRPDGILAKGAIICFWEEDGEYLQMVQPSVGLLLADFLAADPEHPSAKAISAELERISSDYQRRVDENGGWA